MDLDILVNIMNIDIIVIYVGCEYPSGYVYVDIRVDLVDLDILFLVNIMNKDIIVDICWMWIS